MGLRMMISLYSMTSVLSRDSRMNLGESLVSEFLDLIYFELNAFGIFPIVLVRISNLIKEKACLNISKPTISQCKGICEKMPLK